MSLKLVSEGSFNNKPALVQIMDYYLNFPTMVILALTGKYFFATGHC